MNHALPLGTMVVVGYEAAPLHEQLRQWVRTRIRHLELYPNWLQAPSAEQARAACAGFGMLVHAVHAAWGTDSFSGERIDLASTDEPARRRSQQEVRRSLAFAEAAGASCLVVHPGGVSDPAEGPARTDALRTSIDTLLPAAEKADVRLCLENMPGNAFPGRHMRELVHLVRSYDSPLLRICLDTGHSHIVNSVADDIRIAGRFLATTHVHDNDGLSDLHAGPTTGTIAWETAAAALAEVGYAGPLMLECVQWCRAEADRINPDYLARLYRLCRLAAGNTCG